MRVRLHLGAADDLPGFGAGVVGEVDRAPDAIATMMLYGLAALHVPNAMPFRPLFSMKLMSGNSCTSNWALKT